MNSEGNPDKNILIERSSPGNFRFVVCLLGLAGALLLTFLLIRHGIGEVMQAVVAARWGVVAVAIWHLVPLLMDTLSWRSLFPKNERLPLPLTYWMRWVAESVSNLVPASSLGGEFLRARLAATKGVPGSMAAATVIGDITLGIAVQTVFSLIGLVLLVFATGRSNITGPAILGMLCAVGAVGGFYGVQRLGLFRILGSFVGRFADDPAWKSLSMKGDGIDRDVRAVYSNKKAVLQCCACTMTSWLTSSVETWIALHAVGIHAGFDRAIVLESTCQAVRAAMFFIPGGLGVQEGGYVLVGAMLGIPGNAALAISLVRRARELAVGIPGLLAWQFSEGHRLWRSRSFQPAE